MTLSQPPALFEEILSLPLDLKTRLVDTLLDNLNPSRSETQSAWIEEITRRKQQIEEGTVQPIDGDKVFRDIIDELS